jgi:hypothetical protein
MSFVLLTVDFDAPSPAIPLFSFTHRVLYNIPKDQQSIHAAATNAELRRSSVDEGENSAGTQLYEPPCPPLGTHSYIFRLYALDLPRLRPMSNDRQGVLASMRGHIIAYGELVGRFRR